jgi:hypothetical protein
MNIFALARNVVARTLVLTIIAVSLLPHSAVSRATADATLPNRTAQTESAARELIIATKDALTGHDLNPASLCLEYGLELTDTRVASDVSVQSLSSREHLFGVRVPDEKDVGEILAALQADARVDYAEERVAIPVTPIVQKGFQAQSLSTASLRDRQWALRRMEVADGLVLSRVKVGIVDTGADPELANYIAGGWNFYNNTPDYSDGYQHGRYITRLVAGPLGALSQAQLYTLKCVIDSGPDEGRIDMLAFSKSVDWAIAEGIQVLNCSWGASFPPSETQARAIDKAQAAGIVVIAAAGNSHTNNDTTESTWNLPNANILRVASSTENDTLASFSNMGHARVEVTAPGTNIVISEFGVIIGTSASAAWVSAQAALLFEHLSIPGHPAHYNDVLRRICETVDFKEAFASTTWTGGRVNFARALSGDVNPPLDSLSINKPKVKNGKKLKFGITLTPLGTQAISSAVIRVYAADLLLSFIDPSETSFSAKGKFKSGTIILVRSSGVGRAAWVVP